MPSINSCSHGSQETCSFSEMLAQRSTSSSVEDKVSKNTDHFVKTWPKAKAFDSLHVLLAVVSASETEQ